MVEEAAQNRPWCWKTCSTPKQGRLREAAAKSSRQRRVVTDKFKVEVDEQQKGARASLATVRLVGRVAKNRTGSQEGIGMKGEKPQAERRGNIRLL